MISDKKVAFVVANEGIEEVELTKPRSALDDAGATTHIVAPEAGTVQTFNHLDKSATYEVDVTTADAAVLDYDAIVLPGGVANPDQLRMDESAVEFVRAFMDSGKPVAVICHGSWTLVEAGAVDGRTLTSWPSLRTDIENAGGTWVDQEVCVDGNLITSRNPDDIPAFTAALKEHLSNGASDGS